MCTDVAPPAWRHAAFERASTRLPTPVENVAQRAVGRVSRGPEIVGYNRCMENLTQLPSHALTARLYELRKQEPKLAEPAAAPVSAGPAVATAPRPAPRIEPIPEELRVPPRHRGTRLRRRSAISPGGP